MVFVGALLWKDFPHISPLALCSCSLKNNLSLYPFLLSNGTFCISNINIPVLVFLLH